MLQQPRSEERAVCKVVPRKKERGGLRSQKREASATISRFFISVGVGWLLLCGTAQLVWTQRKVGCYTTIIYLWRWYILDSFWKFVLLPMEMEADMKRYNGTRRSSIMDEDDAMQEEVRNLESMHMDEDDDNVGPENNRHKHNHLHSREIWQQQHTGSPPNLVRNKFFIPEERERATRTPPLPSAWAVKNMLSQPFNVEEKEMPAIDENRVDAAGTQHFSTMTTPATLKLNLLALHYIEKHYRHLA